jgi:beta-mannosidase
MFACAIYPHHSEFAASVRSEIRHQTTRLSAHPSIVLWCGNNEVEQNTEMAEESIWKQYSTLAYGTIVQTLREQLEGVQSNVHIWCACPPWLCARACMMMMMMMMMPSKR